MSAGPNEQAAPHVVPSDVLLVEDNYIIALDLEEMLRELGVASIRSASSVRQALDLIAASAPQLALIDVNLGAEKGFEVGERLHQLGIPFVFTTGYGDRQAFPAHFADIRIMCKPYTLEAVRDAIAVPQE